MCGARRDNPRIPVAHHLLPIRLTFRLNRESRHAHGRQLRAQPVQMEKRARMLEKRLAARINRAPNPINPEQEQRILLLFIFT
jgi:hypothetical protein